MKPGIPALFNLLNSTLRWASLVYVDASVAEMTPHVTRLHLCGEPMIAHAIDCAHKAGHAEARIDRWDEALPWLLERLEN